MDQATLHPRLRARREAIGQMLGLADATELAAALDDIQTLLYRCGYHVAFAREERARHLQRRRRSGRTGRARRGRPPGSANWASRQLGLGLAVIWAEQRGSSPTRRFDAVGQRRARGIPRREPLGEHGPFHAFVTCVMDAMPRRIKATRKGNVPEIDYLVRTAIEEFKSVRVDGSEVSRRGLLDEDRWLRGNA